MASITVRNSQTSLAAGATVDVRPPAGETWAPKSIWLPGGNLGIYRRSATIVSGTNMGAAGMSNVLRLRGYFLTNSAYVQLKNNQAAAATMTLIGVLVPSVIVGATTDAAVASLATLSVRPAVGHVYLLQQAGAMEGASTTTPTATIYDGTNKQYASDAAFLRSVDNYTFWQAHLFAVLTNAVYLLIVNADSVTRNFQTISFDNVPGLTNVSVWASLAAAASLDTTPAAGESWSATITEETNAGSTTTRGFIVIGSTSANVVISNTTPGNSISDQWNLVLMDNTVTYRMTNSAGAAQYHHLSAVKF